MSKHTPGPWEASKSVRGHWFIEHEQGGDKLTLTSLDCGELDARLISAAPELAASCEDMMMELEWYAESLRRAGDDSYLEISEMLEKAEAALQKAGI